MLITFEGIEGSGKSTQADRLVGALRAEGRPVTATREPGGTPLGRSIRALVVESDARIEPLAELFLMLADRAEHVGRLIEPALERGEIVVCDRFRESTLAYQAFGRGLPLDVVEPAEAATRGDRLPTRTFLLDCGTEVGLERARARGSGHPDRFEAEGPSFHERVRDGFRALAAEAPERIVVIDAARDVATIGAEILADVRALLERGLP